MKELYSALFKSIGLAIIGIVLSIIFKFLLGSPNYGLGIVMAVTAACYLYGLITAIVTFILIVGGIHAFSFESSYADAFPRLTTIAITSIFTSYLVIILRNSKKNLANALKREQRIAVTMQKAFMPSIPKQIGNVYIESYYEPGSDEADLGGDFIDVFELRNGLVSIALGDVSGKGIDAARQAVIAQCSLRLYAQESKSPEETLINLNSMLIEDPRFAGFITLFHAIFDQNTRLFTYVTGGHEPAFIYHSKMKSVSILESNGQLLGATDNVYQKSDTVKLDIGDIIFIYSDGLSEARNAKGDFLGIEKLLEIFAFHAGNNNFSSIVEETVESARIFADGRFRDDVTAIALKFNAETT